MTALWHQKNGKSFVDSFDILTRSLCSNTLKTTDGGNSKEWMMFIFQQNFSRARAISACQAYRRENVKTTKFQQTKIWHLKTPGRLPGFPYCGWDHVGCRLQKKS
jgi:hypothetical protein